MSTTYTGFNRKLKQSVKNGAAHYPAGGHSREITRNELRVERNKVTSGKHIIISHFVYDHLKNQCAATANPKIFSIYSTVKNLK